MRNRSLVAALTASVVIALGTAASAADEPELGEPTTFTLGPPVERSFGGWTEVARAADTGWLGQVSIVDGTLVSYGPPFAPGGESDVGDVTWYSRDGTTWTGLPLVGETPQVTDMTARPDGSMAIAVGYTLPRGGGDRGPAGAVWTTTDGVEWNAAAAPPVPEVDAVAASDQIVAVAAGGRLWTTTDLQDWTRVKGPRPVGIAYGPGGFLTSEGGGQDRLSATAVWHSADGADWTKVKLPKPIRKAKVGVSTLPLDETWVLLPDAPKLMYISADGQRWRKAPRPPGMTQGYVWWMVDVGEGVQAVGWLPDRKRQPNGLWTFVPGESVDKAKTISGGFVGHVVAWDGETIGYGRMRGEGDAWITHMWRWDPEPAVTTGDASEAPQGESPAPDATDIS